MSKNKSLIEDVELDNGATAYIQINENGFTKPRVSLSFDDKNTSFHIVMTLDELQEYSDKLCKALQDFDNA